MVLNILAERDPARPGALTGLYSTPGPKERIIWSG
jgi:hypothetical protein